MLLWIVERWVKNREYSFSSFKRGLRQQNLFNCRRAKGKVTHCYFQCASTTSLYLLRRAYDVLGGGKIVRQFPNECGNRELTLKCKLKGYEKPMKDPLGVSPSKGNQGTTRGKEKFLLTSVGIEPTTSGLVTVDLIQLNPWLALKFTLQS